MRRIVIEDAGAPENPPESEPKKLDLQDYLLIGGITFSEAAAVVIWWPAALILAAVFCFGFSLMIENAKREKGKRGAAQ